MQLNQPFVLLDRDGTVIVEKDYLSDPDQIELLPGTAAGLRRMQQAGFRLVIVTNQAGVGRGLFSESQAQAVNRRLLDMLAEEQIEIDRVYYCPHAPDDQCECRKPKPGMLNRAIDELHFDPRYGIVIGDKPCDVELGKNAGARALLVRTGYGSQHESSGYDLADAIVDDLTAAADWLDENW